MIKPVKQMTPIERKRERDRIVNKVSNIKSQPFVKIAFSLEELTCLKDTLEDAHFWDKKQENIIKKILERLDA